MVDVTTDFVDQVRYYLEANLQSAVSGQILEFSKPIILILSGIFGYGNEPSYELAQKLLGKFGGWFDGSVSEFMGAKDTKLLPFNQTLLPQAPKQKQKKH